MNDNERLELALSTIFALQAPPADLASGSDSVDLMNNFLENNGFRVKIDWRYAPADIYLDVKFQLLGARPVGDSKRIFEVYLLHLNKGGLLSRFRGIESFAASFMDDILDNYNVTEGMIVCVSQSKGKILAIDRRLPVFVDSTAFVWAGDE